MLWELLPELRALRRYTGIMAKVGDEGPLRYDQFRGKRGLGCDPGEKRVRSSLQPRQLQQVSVGSWPQTRSERYDNGRSAATCPYVCVWRDGEWYPSESVVGFGVWYCFQAHICRGCGIERAPGDKVTVGKIKPTLTYIAGCAYIDRGSGGGYGVVYTMRVVG